jgi:hypothetical protein
VHKSRWKAETRKAHSKEFKFKFIDFFSLDCHSHCHRMDTLDFSGGAQVQVGPNSALKQFDRWTLDGDILIGPGDSVLRNRSVIQVPTQEVATASLKMLLGIKGRRKVKDDDEEEEVKPVKALKKNDVSDDESDDDETESEDDEDALDDSSVASDGGCESS